MNIRLGSGVIKGVDSESANSLKIGPDLNAW